MGSSGPPVTPLRPGLQPAPSATLFAVALLSTATEADAMNESDTFSSYTVVEPINDDTPLPDLNSCSASSSACAAARAQMDCPGQRTMSHPAAA